MDIVKNPKIKIGQRYTDRSGRVVRILDQRAYGLYVTAVDVQTNLLCIYALRSIQPNNPESEFIYSGGAYDSDEDYPLLELD